MTQFLRPKGFAAKLKEGRTESGCLEDKCVHFDVRLRVRRPVLFVLIDVRWLTLYSFPVRVVSHGTGIVSFRCSKRPGMTRSRSICQATIGASAYPPTRTG